MGDGRHDARECPTPAGQRPARLPYSSPSARRPITHDRVAVAPRAPTLPRRRGLPREETTVTGTGRTHRRPTRRLRPPHRDSARSVAILMTMELLRCTRLSSRVVETCRVGKIEVRQRRDGARQGERVANEARQSHGARRSISRPCHDGRVNPSGLSCSPPLESHYWHA